MATVLHFLYISYNTHVIACAVTSGDQRFPEYVKKIYVSIVVKSILMLGPLTLKFDRATWSFLKFDRRH